MDKVRKAVFPVGGLGTRFLPATKASAKEMMPVVDKPLIQYAVEEAIAAGCDQLIFITGRGKRAIADHFDVSYELEVELESRGKQELLDQVRQILPSHVSAIFIRQPQPLGLGHAVYCARPVIGNEPFAILLADDLIMAEKPVLQQMVERFERYNTGILAIQEVARAETRNYGIIDGKTWDDGLFHVSGIVEKPQPEHAPSTLAVIGRYILPARIFYHLVQTPKGAGGEIQLTDAIARLLLEKQILAYQFDGTRFDCGDKLGYLKATIEFALRHPQVGSDFAEYLRDYCASLSEKKNTA